MTTVNLSLALDVINAMQAPLGERLRAYALVLRQANSPFAAAYDELSVRLANGEIGATAPSPGDVMPDFLLPSKARALVSLQDLIRDGPLVISFNRGHWCPFCRIELKTFADYQTEIRHAGGSVVSIMPDRQEFISHLDPKTSSAMQILTDIDCGYSLSVGLVIWLGDTLKELVLGNGFNLEIIHGSNGWFVPLPATYVIGRDQRVVARFVDPDIRRRMEIDDIVEALKRA